ncbi:DUF4442 domain-containing protein [Rufibacter hautae]|uniref:DUF4442 domain-containing protein n=1 Tax=Rufibacter hautae TaxID=2595005 RepID=A0A5B6TAY5_9BACT|nr:DUF4442 domain-containing protein [Rufibacter hautae]KAA3436283.1 DUF4442 domain-containing protein [Rufibacter hautae]
MTTASTAPFRHLITNPVKLKLFLLKNLPMAYLAGIRIKRLTEEEAQVTIGYKYLTKNPFRSIYFACLSMAAEMASGVLSMMYLHGAQPSVSMLVVGLEADFSKKAVGTITFTCHDGEAIAAAVRSAQTSGQSHNVQALSIGRNEQGEEVARFRITWSYKARSSRG